jgi:hypothetical protein
MVWKTRPAEPSKPSQGNLFEPGTCRICGCTDLKPCRMLPDPERPIAGQNLMNCAWVDKSRTLCTNPACLRKAGLE